jgi:hypothetical protein
MFTGHQTSTRVRLSWSGNAVSRTRADLVRMATAAAGVLASAGLLVGCSASGTVGIGSNVVSKATVEHNVAKQLAAEVHQPLPKISCPGDLQARIGTKMTCVLTPQGANARYDVTVKVSSLKNGIAHFTAQVANQPLG